MNNAQVQITNDAGATATVMASSLRVWLAHGWTLVEREAGVEQVEASGEGAAVDVPPASPLPAGHLEPDEDDEDD